MQRTAEVGHFVKKRRYSTIVSHTFKSYPTKYSESRVSLHKVTCSVVFLYYKPFCLFWQINFIGCKLPIKIKSSFHVITWS